ncbi:hypothetical protein MATL_G00150710 [Megalops atlanticus]|uniref:Sulfotransferase n=1 Tax=Megalops atlanticus TaxID=7932 RepID=A0A9D3PSN2_MEGAT|nr:hypothetical protein MATL_G00150710 [Megalops atlanticus]
MALWSNGEKSSNVIQLFRDPRAVHNSRLKSKLALVKESIQVLRSQKQTDKYKRLLMPSNRANRAESYVSSAMELICDNWLNDMLLVMNAPQWVKRNYIQLRYEDLVLNPVEELRRLYRFSNLTSFPNTKSRSLMHRREEQEEITTGADGGGAGERDGWVLP